MLARRLSKLLRHSYSRAIFNCRNFSSRVIEMDATERDPAPYFFDEEVQTYLKTLTTLNYAKVFRTRMDGHKDNPPEFRFMTDEQLEQAMQESKQLAEKHLQMPPVVKPREEVITVLDKDIALLNHDTANFVFTDITFGLKNKDRIIVVREPDGTLRNANWGERERMNQLYFSVAGKEYIKPRMFKDEHLKNLLQRNEYEFILDRACIQFEPDDPEYQAITQEVYEYINREKHFDTLRSTRHFGPMVFHLVWTSNIDTLLCEMIETKRIEDAVLLIRLYHKIHPTVESAVNQCETSDNVEFILHYARLDSPKTSTIEKLVQSYKELLLEHERLKEGIKKAHGIISNSEKDKM